MLPSTAGPRPQNGLTAPVCLVPVVIIPLMALLIIIRRPCSPMVATPDFEKITSGRMLYPGKTQVIVLVPFSGAIVYGGGNILPRIRDMRVDMTPTLVIM